MTKTLTLGNFAEKDLNEALAHLRQKHGKEAFATQIQKAARKMVTELHTKSVARGAVEGVNLASRFRDDDPLAAECIRTFRTITFQGASLLRREELVAQISAEDHVDVAVKLKRTWAGLHTVVNAPMDMLYGFRPQSPLLWWLSPYEFYIWWCPVPVVPPHVQKQNPMSAWTEAGEAYHKAMSEAKAPMKATPGLHHRVLAVGDWLVLPELEELKTLPHRWVLKRRERPMVPLFRRQKVPSARFTEEEKARMCNVYMRP